jgi:hypothetical protein
VRHFPDGRNYIRFPNGTKRQIFPDGAKETFLFSEGIREEASGKKEITGIPSFVSGASCLSSKGDLKCGVK